MKINEKEVGIGPYFTQKLSKSARLSFNDKF